jgi:hypothetical protein
LHLNIFCLDLIGLSVVRDSCHFRNISNQLYKSEKQLIIFEKEISSLIIFLEKYVEGLSKTSENEIFAVLFDDKFQKLIVYNKKNNEKE